MPISRKYVMLTNNTATTEIYTLSLHDALPISSGQSKPLPLKHKAEPTKAEITANDLMTHLYIIADDSMMGDRKSTRLNSSHVSISYAVFCLKKKKHRIITVSICRQVDQT